MLAGSEAQKAALLPKIAAGDLIGCVATSEGPGVLSASALQTVTTTWALNPGGTCQRRIITYSNLVGSSDTTTRGCTFRMANFAIDVTFSGATGPVRYPYDFPGFSPTRLLLGGVEYQKL